MGLYDRDGAQERGEPSLRRTDVKRDGDPFGNKGGDALRATPFTDEVFNDREDRVSRQGGLSASLMVGVALGAVLVAGVGWYAFKAPSGGELVEGQTQTIKAEATPYKMKPDNPGGMQVENQDKLVYDRVAKGAAPKREENLLPPPEEPKEPPKMPPKEVAKAPDKLPEVKAPEPKAGEKTPEKALEKAPEKTAEKTMESIVKEANNQAPASSAKPAAPSSDAAALAAAVAAATGKADLAPKAAEPAVTKPPEPKAPEPKLEVAAVTPAAPTPGTPGAFQIQLASVPTEEAANSEWKRISGKHQDLFAALTPSITKADLGEKGIYYRLRAGPLADKAAADQLCASLAADRIGCIVVKP